MLSGLHLNIKSELGLSFCSTDQFLEEIKDQLFKFSVMFDLFHTFFACESENVTEQLETKTKKFSRLYGDEGFMISSVFRDESAVILTAFSFI